MHRKRLAAGLCAPQIPYGCPSDIGKTGGKEGRKGGEEGRTPPISETWLDPSV